jgi:hypothetical protein
MARGLMAGKKKTFKPKYMTISKEYHVKTQSYDEWKKENERKKKKKGK